MSCGNCSPSFAFAITVQALCIAPRPAVDEPSGKCNAWSLLQTFSISGPLVRRSKPIKFAYTPMSSGCLASHDTARTVIMVLVRKYFLDLSYRRIIGEKIRSEFSRFLGLAAPKWALRPLFSFLNARAAGDDLRHSTRREFASLI